MTPVSKTLCKLKKAERAKKALELDDPEAMFVCKKCGRAAKSKKRLCKPRKLFPISNA